MGGIIHVVIVVPPLLPWLLKNVFIPHCSIKLSLESDPRLSKRGQTSSTDNEKYIFGLLKKGELIQNSCVQPFADWADLNLVGLLCLVLQIQWHK